MRFEILSSPRTQHEAKLLLFSLRLISVEAAAQCDEGKQQGKQLLEEKSFLRFAFFNFLRSLAIVEKMMEKESRRNEIQSLSFKALHELSV